MKKRLKEAEEEQYRVWILLDLWDLLKWLSIIWRSYLSKAEEDAAAFRAELNSLQQQNIGNIFGNIPSTNKSEEQIISLEKEIMDLKSELQVTLIFWACCLSCSMVTWLLDLLQQLSVLRQQEQQKLIEEQLKTSTLLAEKQDLEGRLEAFSKKVLGMTNWCTSFLNNFAASHKPWQT